jgi:hypothetical protein
MMTPLMNSPAPAVKEHFTISAPALLDRLDAECIEPFQGGDGFVCRQNPLPSATRASATLFEVVGHHEIP